MMSSKVQLALWLTISTLSIALVASQESKACKEGFIRCNSGGGCRPFSQWCDGKRQCGDGSDEKNCVDNPADPSTKMFRCPEGKTRCGKTGFCIASYLWCDNNLDCPDGDDEPPKYPTCKSYDCPPGYKKCSVTSSVCRLKSLFCNGRTDCPKEGNNDNQDEQKCATEACGLDIQQKCDDNQQCIYKIEKCDKTEDCKDKSDEKDCNYRTLERMKV